jgi:hypothetical protein
MKAKGCKWICWLVVSLFVVMTACGSSDDAEQAKRDQQSHEEHENVEAPLQVDVTLEPETVQVGTETAIQAVITQGGEAVTDAHSVSFEIGAAGSPREEWEKVDAEWVDGSYQGTYTFPEADDYQVMYHVTARGSHAMDTVAVSVQP